MADSDLEAFLSVNEKRGLDEHPLIRLLVARMGDPAFGEARVQVRRLRAALGFEPAGLVLEFRDKQGRPYDYKDEDWDPVLNGELVRRGIKAIDEANEIVRFGLGMAAGFKEAETRYGDGYFNAVLMSVVRETPFVTKAPIQAMLPHITALRTPERTGAAVDCRAMVVAAMQDRWYELRRDLDYDQESADRIMTGALAYYLDERFTVTDRRRLGWLTSR